jgi:hypothetical protein
MKERGGRENGRTGAGMRDSRTEKAECGTAKEGMRGGKET